MCVSQMLSTFFKPRSHLIVTALVERGNDMRKVGDSFLFCDVTGFVCIENVTEERVHVVLVTIGEFSCAGHAFLCIEDANGCPTSDLPHGLPVGLVVLLRVLLLPWQLQPEVQRQSLYEAFQGAFELEAFEIDLFLRQKLQKRPHVVLDTFWQLEGVIRQ